MTILTKVALLPSALMIVLATAQPALPQSSSTVDEEFAELTHSLSGKAERLLTDSSAQRNPDSNRTANEVTTATSIATTGKGASRRWRDLRVQIEPILKVQGLPVEMLAVVKVESGGQVDALSRAGARGLWQLMPNTARRYGLVVSNAGDERLDPERSTWAATAYLRDLHAMFGDWRLALAAYNAGEDAISRAILRSGSRDFEVLTSKRLIPEETRKYVPAILAAMRQIGSAGEAKLPNVMATLLREDSRVYASTDAGD